MSKAGKHIYKRKDGRWEGRYIKDRVNGKVRYGAVYGHSCEEAKRKLAAAKEELAKTMVAMDTGKAGTVQEVSAAWITEASTNLKVSSVNKYEDILKNHIEPRFGNIGLSDITNRDLIGFSNYLLTEGSLGGRGLAPSTVKQIMSVMNSLRIHALRRDHTVGFTTACVVIKGDNKEIRVFSMEEEEKLITWLCENYDLTALGILLCLFSGLRIGEVCALKWDDLDFEADTICVTKTMQRIRVKGSDSKKTEVQILAPKSECSIRTIPIPENLRGPLLSEYREGAFLLTGKKEDYVEPRTLQNRFKRVLKKAGIADANFHTTRHTYATRCVEQGVDIKCLSEMLGHANVSITLNRYVHPSMNLKKENLRKLTDQYPVDVAVR